jgi:hypothetical protein
MNDRVSYFDPFVLIKNGRSRKLIMAILPKYDHDRTYPLGPKW